MKIRSGFVSNSSSSSFIIKGSFDELFKAISDMALIVQSDLNNYSEGNTITDYTNGLATVNNTPEIKDTFRNGNVGIAFHSINYNTYITSTYDNAKEQYIFTVDTCINHLFNFDASLDITYYEEGGEVSTNISYENSKPGVEFYWLNEQKVRSVIHYPPYDDKRFPFICTNKKCKPVYMTFRFDTEMKMRCNTCDSLLVHKSEKIKHQYEKVNIVTPYL